MVNNFTFLNETSAACKWFERGHYLKTPIDLEKKLKQCSTSESDYNNSRFCTPPEIYRKTSTPMFIGQKDGFETPCVPNFSLKTPKTNSPSIAILNTQTSETQFFSFLLHASNEETPFRISKDEEFSRSNSGRKLSITEEEEKIVEETEKTTANVIEVSSPVDMDLMKSEGGLQDSPKSDDNREDVVKKVRFSDEHKIVAELGNVMESCVRSILNMSTEEEEFHDAHDVTNAQKAKTIEGTKDAKKTVDTSSIVEDTTNTSESQAEDRRRSLIQPLGNFLNDSQIRIIRDNTKNINKENRDPEVSNESSSTTNQRDSNRVLMMVLMESNSGGLTTDLMPLINSGLKKFQEQLTSANCQSPSSAVESAKVCRRSITMRMSISSVESYSANGAATMTNREHLASSHSLSPVRIGENNVTRSNSGFLSTIAQVMKDTLKNFPGR